MASRLQLQLLLESFLPTGKRAYFQPPNNIQMAYPCIVYNFDNDEVEFADNKPYSRVKRYQVTVIDRNPDSTIPDEVAWLPMAKLNRTFVTDNLHHTVFSLFF